MSETRKYRQFTVEQKAEIVLAGLRGDRSVRDVCRAYEIAETLYYQWRDRLLEGGKAALAHPQVKIAEHAEIAELRKKATPGKTQACVHNSYRHSAINVTMNIYAHVLPEVQRAAADRLDELLSSGAD
jgi:transposase